jgi:hypothetical protein
LSNRLLKILSLSLVAVVLLAQAIDQQHLHVDESVESVCEVCGQTDTPEALLTSNSKSHTQTNVAVAFLAAVSVSLAAKQWTRHSRAPPHNLA